MRRININDLLNLDGIPIEYVVFNGCKWFPLKHLCKAMGVDWNRQWKNTRKDQAIKQYLQLIRIHDGIQHRRMVCISENGLVGYICQARSKSPKFIAYKVKCFNVLYEHFRGSFDLQIPLAGNN